MRVGKGFLTMIQNLDLVKEKVDQFDYRKLNILTWLNSKDKQKTRTSP